MVDSQNVGIGVYAELMEQARGALDIGEQHGDRPHRPANHGFLLGHPIRIVSAQQ